MSRALTVSELQWKAAGASPLGLCIRLSAASRDLFSDRAALQVRRPQHTKTRLDPELCSRLLLGTCVGG
jgi:hypothetical protein